MAMLSVIGEWLDGSGWTYVMTVANVTTEGRAIGQQRGLHTSRGQWAHQVTAAALFQLLNRSYTEYRTNRSDEEQLNFKECCKYMASTHPQFDYWQKVLQFMRSQRLQQFMDYVVTRKNYSLDICSRSLSLCFLDDYSCERFS